MFVRLGLSGPWKQRGVLVPGGSLMACPPVAGGGCQAPVERTEPFTMFHPPALAAVLSSKLGSINKFVADAETIEMRKTTAAERQTRFSVNVCIFALSFCSLFVTLGFPGDKKPCCFSSFDDTHTATTDASVFFCWISPLRCFISRHCLAVSASQASTTYQRRIVSAYVPSSVWLGGQCDLSCRAENSR